MYGTQIASIVQISRQYFTIVLGGKKESRVRSGVLKYDRSTDRGTDRGIGVRWSLVTP